ncbi:hypothetical protein [Bacillus phage Carmen17]|uniref:HTH cro/C1-type domain-containing protein n=1 Tax=Bacillus phage Carmen17 TaxID=2072797 RepID=A0A2I7QIM5_9CAUD|nr:hypothetical protein HWB53_gp30 [Bacillus phage Carmen17]AUR81254.1 hypothetical protein [Bacillus phage Carmen17]
MDKKNMYKPLRLYFVEHGIRQREVAEHIGVTESVMSQIMGGYGRQFTVDEAVKIITKYGGTIDLFTNKN